MQNSRTAYVILGMLSMESNRSGYDIRKAIESSVGYFWSESYGQIYPTLKQLAAEGLITASESDGKRQRQQYSITPAGEAALRDWLALPFQNDPPRNEFLLKLFFGKEAGPAVLIAQIKDLQERNRRNVAMMNGMESMVRKYNAGNPHLPYWLLTLGFGMTLTRAALDWGETALASLAELERAQPTDFTAERSDR